MAAFLLPAAPTKAPNWKLSEPPQQRMPWTPPQSDIPDAFVSAAAKMFDLGLADPRGCEYRAVTLTVPLPWGTDGEPVKTHAWVLPPSDGFWRYAVGWDGLVYPVAEIGPSADVAADVRAAVKRYVDARAPRDPLDTNKYVQQAPERRWSLSHEGSLADTAVALLLRLGEGGRAEELWKQSRPEKGQVGNQPAVNDPFVALAREWAWKHYERGLLAHQRGDDRLALASLRTLSTTLPFLEGEADRREFSGRLADFLDQLPQLLADQERRAAARPRKRVVCIGPGRDPDPAVRIAALIDRLDEAAVRHGFDYCLGGGRWCQDAVVRALAAEGDAAIDPLLKCLESDTRLTRSSDAVLIWDQTGAVRGVSDAAYYLLARSAYSPVEPTVRGKNLTRQELAAAIRARRARAEGSMSRAERWYRRLADAAATPKEWVRAAETLAEDERVAGWSPIWWDDQNELMRQSSPGGRPRVFGESLRNRTDLSLTNLLTRRIGHVKDPATAAQLGLCLAARDKAAAKSVLPGLTARCRAVNATDLVVELVKARVAAGDLTALDEFADWFPQPAKAGFDPQFQLMIKYADHPAMARAAQRLFAGPKTPWRPTIDGEDFKNWRNVDRFLASGLLRFPAFRSAVLDLINVKTEVGEFTIYDSSVGREFRIGGGSAGQLAAGWVTTADAPATFRGPSRMCDYMTYEIAKGIGAAPRFEGYWPAEKRDEAVAACAAFIRKYGPRAGGGEETDGLVFPVHEHPATRAEVEKGDAVFSLEGQGPTRLVPLSRRPLPAIWLTLRDVTTDRYVWRAGKGRQEKGFLQEGFVWQAEEVQIAGRWQRYYGFAGSHRIARVPAAEIEFPIPGTDSRWLRYSGMIDARLATPRGTIDPDQPGPPRRVVGGTVPVSLAVRNAGGSSVVLPKLAGQVRLLAWYSPEVIAPQGMLAPAAKSDAVWEELAASPEALFPERVGQMLAPPAETVIGDIDLTKWFDLSRSGFYRIRLTKSGSADSAANPIIFSLGAAPTP